MDEQVKSKLVDFFSGYKLLTVEKGKTLIRGIDETPSIYFIKEGVVKQYVTTENGENLALHLFRNDSFFPIMLSIGSSKNKYTFETIAKTTVYEAPAEDVIAFLKSEPDVLYDLTIRLSKGINGLLQKIENLSFTNTEERLISLLRYMGEKFGEKEHGTIVIKLPLTHADIASWIGAQRETVSREMEKLKNQGIIEYDKKIITILRTDLFTHS